MLHDCVSLSDILTLELLIAQTCRMGILWLNKANSSSNCHMALFEQHAGSIRCLSDS